MFELHRPGSGVGLGIVNRNLDLQVAEVGPPEPFGYLAGFGEWITGAVEPDVVTESNGLDDQRILLPFARRVTIKGRIRIGGQWPPVGENLAVIHVFLVENREESGN